MAIYQVDNLKQKFTDFLAGQYLKKLSPKFIIVLVGDDFASRKYIEMKLKLAEQLGIETEFLNFSESTSKQEIKEVLQRSQSGVCGIIFQLPIRADLSDLVTDLSYKFDLDLLGSESFKLLNKGFLPPTIGAIDLVLKDIFFQGLSPQTSPSKNEHVESPDFEDTLNSKLSFKNLVVGVIGQGILVGNPLLRYLSSRNATIISVNVDTLDSKELTKQADILISATGVGGLVDKTWLKKAHTKTGFGDILFPIVIDAGTSEGQVIQEMENHKVLIGDVKTQDVSELCTLVAVPGGVGPITVRYIFWNLLKLYNLP